MEVLARRPTPHGNRDTRINKVDFTWTTDANSANCSNRYGLEAIMTHERGHTFDLGHVASGQLLGTGAERGSHTVNVVPSASVERNSTRPPCARAMWSTM
jgi:hypothetical protein